jgi:hypothetical protein
VNSEFGYQSHHRGKSQQEGPFLLEGAAEGH